MKTNSGTTQSCVVRTMLVVGATLLMIDNAVAQDSGETPQETQDPQVESSIGIDATNQYFYRGIQQENQGAIVQPWVDFVFPLYEGENTSWSFNIGLWNSLHGGPTGSSGAGQTMHYEMDIYAGIGVGFADNWSGSVSYVALTSPNSAFATVQELDFSISFDDAGLFGGESSRFSGVQPSVMVIWELDGQSDGGAEQGIYLEVGIEPAIDLSDAENPISVSFPVVTGLSLSNYYEGPGATGSDDFFGFAQAGVVLSTPLNFVSARLGGWTLSGGVTIMFFGNNLQAINGGDATEAILSLGLGIAF